MLALSKDWYDVVPLYSVQLCGASLLKSHIIASLEAGYPLFEVASLVQSASRPVCAQMGFLRLCLGFSVGPLVIPTVLPVFSKWCKTACSQLLLLF